MSLGSVFHFGAETAGADTDAFAVNAAYLQIHLLAANRGDVGVATRMRPRIVLFAINTDKHSVLEWSIKYVW